MSRDKLLARLRDMNVERVEAAYDGYGDEGSLTSVELYGPGDVEIDDPNDGLLEEVDKIVCEVLSRVWPGWEVNDGCFGTATIMVATGKVEVDHGRRYTEIDYDSHEGDL